MSVATRSKFSRTLGPYAWSSLSPNPNRGHMYGLFDSPDLRPTEFYVWGHLIDNVFGEGLNY